MDESSQGIRIEIEGRWSADDMGRMLVAIAELYDLRFYLEILRDEEKALERYYFDAFERLPRSRLWRRRIPWAFGPMWGVLPPLDETQLSRISQLIHADEHIQIRRLSFASPGSVDLVGIGAVVGHLKDLILRLIERRDSKQDRALSVERAELENDHLRIENARTFVALARDLGYSDLEIRRMVSYVDNKQEPLVKLVDDDRLQAISDLNITDQG
jgi:hypothetical protein